MKIKTTCRHNHRIRVTLEPDEYFTFVDFSYGSQRDRTLQVRAIGADVGLDGAVSSGSGYLSGYRVAEAYMIRKDGTPGTQRIGTTYPPRIPESAIPDRLLSVIQTAAGAMTCEDYSDE